MKERPILFNADMVRALLDGRKTQTRRIVKPQPPTGIESDLPGWSALMRRCPYGQPGDRLWVRETTFEDCVGSVSLARYASDNAIIHESHIDPAQWWYSRKLCPSIHMPRWASRITLEIVSVRVERLQDISEDDAKAEGVIGEKEATEAGLEWFDKPRRAFRFLWQSINGAESWDANPWVWVVELKRVEAA